MHARWERKIKRTLLSKAPVCLLLRIIHNGYSNEYHILTWYKKCVVWSNWSLLWTQSSSELPAVKMAPILSRPLGRLLIPTLSRAMSSGYLVHEPKYSFLKVKISAEMMLVMQNTSPVPWRFEELAKLLQQDLGLEESNKGVFDGSWKGSGEVKVKNCGITNKIEGILSFGSVLQFDQNIEKISISYSRQQCRQGHSIVGRLLPLTKSNLHMFF